MENTYGWAIDLSITKTGIDNPSSLISINLSLPGGNTVSDWLTTNSIPIDTDQNYTDFFSKQTKELLMSSEWQILEWFLLKEGADSPIKLKNLVSSSLTQEDDLKQKIDEYLKTLPNIKQNPSKTWKPFDVDNTDNGRTLVHALAPLSYLPADVSTALKRSFVYTDDLETQKTNDAEPIPPARYIVYPQFTINNTEYNVDLDKIKYTNDGFVKLEYKDHKVVFYCSVENGIAKPKPTLLLKKQDSNPAIWKANVLGFISPACLLVKSVLSQQPGLFNFYGNDDEIKSALKNQIKSLSLFLFRSIGAGWGMSYIDNSIHKSKGLRYDNLLNVFIDAEKNIEYKEITLPNNGGFLKNEESVATFINELSKYKNINDTDLIKFIEYCANLNDQLNSTEPNQAPLMKIMAQLQNQEVLKKVSVLCWFVHNTDQNQLLSNVYNLEKIIKCGISQDVIDQAQYALLVESPFCNNKCGVLANLKSNALPDGTDVGEKLIDALSHLLVENKDELKNVRLTIAQEVELLYTANNNSNEHQLKPKDDGLKFSFEGDKNEDEDEKYRGYAIALEVSDDKSNWKDAAWITDVQIGLTESKTIISEFLHETIGATETNSATVSSFEYTGNPLVASKVTFDGSSYNFVNESDDKNDDGTDYIDYVWPINNSDNGNLPKLGYGLWYRGIATPIGNAGEIFDQSLWYKLNPTKLLNAAAAIKKINKINNHTPQQYLSCVPPGAPTVIFDAESLTKLQELSEETKAYVYQASVSKSNKPLPVALLCNEDKSFIKEKCSPKFTLRFHKPIPNIDFLEKWKNGDNSSSINLKDFSTKLEEFNKLKNKDYLHLNDDGDEIGNKVKTTLKAVCIHPAVEKVLVSVQINGGTNCLKVLEITNLNTLTIERADQDLFDDNALNVKLNGGSFCKIEFFSLIKEELFTGTNKKFNSNAFDNSFKNDEDEIESEGEKYRQFGPAEYWFEASPACTETKSELAPEVKSKEKESLVELSIASNLDATWIRSVEFQRHEWHWTGYPATFPDVDSGFDKWLSSFVGVESYREEDNYVLNSYIDSNGWKIGTAVVVHQHQLASGPRPAKYIAFSVRPKIRFSKWIKQDAQIRKDIESKIFANGTLAKGIPIDLLQERIPVPRLKWAIPLSATYTKPSNPNDLLPERTQNGNLLIFDEAFKRTDSLVRFGGIGDTIDIEVMGTRIRDIHEFGVNPIFHGYERLADHTLLCDEPFGLTYDITRNAKVAHTGMVVRPKLAKGKWMLAKVRARRYVNPDTLTLDNFKKNDDGTIQIQVRKVGDSLVPIDLCIEFKEATKLCSLKLGEKFYTGNYPLKPATRFMVTFEKFEGKTGWKIGITAQNNNNKLDYKTIDRVSCFSDTPLIVEEKSGFTKLEINKDIVYTVKPLVISDFTDPIWLSFIGSFGVDAKLLKHDDCEIEKKDENLIFKSKIDGLTSHFKRPDDDNACFQVLMVYEPVQDIYKTGKEIDGGRFVGFYVYGSNAGSIANFIKTAKAGDIKDISNDAYAYLIDIQKATAMSYDERKKFNSSSKLDLMDLLFPTDGESKIKITPKYVGPIKIN